MSETNEKWIYDITEFPYKREISKRVTYPFFLLNKVTGGGEIGNVIILFSKTNNGKSELMMQFITHWAQTGEKVCAMLGEHTYKKAQELLFKKVSKYDKDKWQTKAVTDNEGKDIGIYETFISKEDEENAIHTLKGKVYLYNTNKGFSLEKILQGFQAGYDIGCTVFVLDNQMMIDLETNYELREQTDNTERLRQWAKKHQVIVFLVAHARKIEVNRIRLTESDINGSSNISNKAQTIMTITRTDTLNPTTKEYKDYARLLELNYIDIHKCNAILEVVKEKNAKGGFVPLKWFESTKTFREVYDPEMTKKKQEDAKKREQKYGKQNNDDIDVEQPVLFNPHPEEMVELTPSMLDSLPWDD